MRQCPHKHDLAYRQRWVPPEVSPALQKGSLWHLVLEAHYRRLMDIQKEQKRGIVYLSRHIGTILAKEVQPLLYNEAAQQNPVQELIEWMYKGYVEQYGVDENWRILAVEHEAVVTLPSRTGGRSTFRLKMKNDLVIRVLDLPKEPMWLVDHKSAKDLPSDREFELDDQFGLYTWGLRQLGRKILGAIHSTSRTHRNVRDPQTLPSRFKRYLQYRTDPELDTIAREAYETASQLYGKYEEGEAPRFPNPDTCRWRCSFLEPCLAGRKGFDEKRFLLDRGFEVNKERH